MTATIDQWLSRARLRDDVPALPPSLDEGRSAIAHPGSSQDVEPPAGPNPGTCGPEREAHRDLTTLCETVITLTSIDHLAVFLTQSLVPEPGSARTLACFLQLGALYDEARFWWQFAAGAGDHTASFCLYLQHLSFGETTPAAWWQHQIPDALDTDEDLDLSVLEHTLATDASLSAVTQAADTDASLLTTLRVLRRLKRDRPASLRAQQPVVQAALDYIPHAVAFVDDDLELPLPGSEFTDHIHHLSAQVTANPPRTASPPPAERLPCRPPGRSAIQTAVRRAEAKHG